MFQALLEKIWALIKISWGTTKKKKVVGSMAIVDQMIKSFLGSSQF
jgi:hypothetical protein